MDDASMERDRDEGLREALRDGFPPPPFPEAEIEDRIRATLIRRGERWGRGAPRPGASGPWWRGGTARSVLAVAASLVLFIGGMEYGRRTALPAGYPTPGVVASGPVENAESLPLVLQSAGSRYVASLARFSGEANSLTPRQRQVAREVALATIYGATLELLRESGDDQTLQAVLQMVAARRNEIGAAGSPGSQSF